MNTNYQIDTEKLIKNILDLESEIRDRTGNTKEPLLIIVPKELYYLWLNQDYQRLLVIQFLEDNLSFKVKQDLCCLSNMLFMVDTTAFKYKKHLDISIKDLHLSTNKDAVKLLLIPSN